MSRAHHRSADNVLDNYTAAAGENKGTRIKEDGNIDLHSNRNKDTDNWEEGGKKFESGADVISRSSFRICLKLGGTHKSSIQADITHDENALTIFCVNSGDCQRVHQQTMI